MQISSNGIVALGDGMAPLNEFGNDTFPIPNQVFIAPFYGDVYPGGLDGARKCVNGTVYYSDLVTTDNATRERAKTQIQGAFPDHMEFSPSYLIVARWMDVRHYEMEENKVNRLTCTMYGTVQHCCSVTRSCNVYITCM